MSYKIKYILSFNSDRGNSYELHILQKGYEGDSVVKKLGATPVLAIEEGDGAIKGSSLAFAIQADVEGELRQLYTTNNKEFKVQLYRNSVLYWQGYLLPELYSESYIDPPYDVTVTASDQLAVLKNVPYAQDGGNKSLLDIITYILSHTLLNLKIIQHVNLTLHGNGEFLSGAYVSTEGYYGQSCYDVLNNILLSCNACIQQINNEWVILSLTNKSTAYVKDNSNINIPHAQLGQMGNAPIYPEGSLLMTNIPAVKGVALNYSHLLKKSFLKNADCVSKDGWQYTLTDDVSLSYPGVFDFLGVKYECNCWYLPHSKLQDGGALQVWQDVALKSDTVYNCQLSVDYRMDIGSSLLLMAVIHEGSDGKRRRLTSDGWKEGGSATDKNSYINITGTPSDVWLVWPWDIADFSKYEKATVQFQLPAVDGKLRVGFINATEDDYVNPLTKIFLTKVYLTYIGIAGKTSTTVVEEDATNAQQDVALAFGDTSGASNDNIFCYNTLRDSSGNLQNVFNLQQLSGVKTYDSYFLAMLQDMSRYYGVKKVSLQGTLMGNDVLHLLYEDVFSGNVMRLVSGEYDLLQDAVNVVLEEVPDCFVDYETEVYATDNSSSPATSSGVTSVVGGGGGESLFAVRANGDVYVKNEKVLTGSEADFEQQVVPGSAPAEAKDGKVYVYAGDEGIAQEVNDQQINLGLMARKVNGLWGCFDNGVAKDAAKLGGQMPSYYATASALGTTNDNLSAITTRVGNAEGAITAIQSNYVDKGSAQTITGVKTFQNGLKIGDIKLEWDSTNQALKIIGNAYVTELFSMGKISESGSGGGGAAGIVTVRVNGVDYSSVNGVVTLPNYPSLAGYATEKWVTDKGYITASAIPTSLPASDVYAWAKKASLAASDVPNLDWSKITSGKPTTLAGYGISDAFFLHTTSIYLGVRFANGEYATGDKYLEWWNSAGWVNHMSAKYIVAGATSSHFLKGDGSLDNTAYLPISGGTINGTLRIENAHASLNLIRTGGDSGFITYLGGSDWRVTNHQWQKEYVLWHTGNLDPSAFLPLTGGTMDGNLKINAKNYLGLVVNSPDNNLNQLQLQVNGTLKGMLQYNANFGFGFHYEGFGGLYIKGDGTPIYVDSNTTRCTLIHSGNIAEQLDSRYFRTRYESIPTDKDLATLAAGSYWVYENTGLSNKVPSTYSSLVVLGKSYYAPQLSVVHNASRAWLRGVYNSETPSVSDWHELAFIDSVVSGAGYAERLSKTWREDPNYTSGSNLKLINNPASTQGNYASGYSSGLSVMTDYVGWQMMSYGGDVQNPYFRSYQDNGTWKPWRQLAFLDDNVASADYATNAGKLGGYDAGAYPVFEEASSYIAFNLRANYQAKGQGSGYIEFYDRDWYNCIWGKVTATYGLEAPSVTTSGALQYSAPSGHNFLGGDVTIGNLTNDGQKLLVDGSVGLRGITEITYNHQLGSTGWNWHTVYSSNTGNDGDIVNIRLSHSYWYLGTDSVELKIAIGYYNCKIIQTIYNFGGSGAFSSVRVRRVGSTHYIDVYMYNSVAATDRFFVSGSGKGTFQAPTLCTTNEGLIDSLGLAVGQSRLQDTYIVGSLTVLGGGAFGGDVTSEGTIAMAKLASSSDKKLKENIKWLSTGKSMEVVRALRPTEWNWKKDSTHSFGFIAQDVAPIVPEMVSNINDTLRLEYNQLHAFEIGAIQHIDSEVEQLKKDLKTANNRIEVLENELNEYMRNAQWQ